MFPEVGSIKVSPGLIFPSRSASSIIRFAMRSLTEPPALKNSHFAKTCALIPKDWGMRLRRTSGVSPMWSTMVSRIALSGAVVDISEW